MTDFPEQPAFLNLAAQYFDTRDMREDASKINSQIKEKFPLFLFWRLNECANAFLERDAEKMKELLGDELRLDNLYPDRKLFHSSEYISYTKTAMLYFGLINDIEALNKRLDEAKKFAEKHNLDIKILQRIAVIVLRDSLKRKGSLNRTQPEATILPALPDFHFKEVEALYVHDLTIPDEMYDSLLQKDRKLIIEDLEKLLQHGIDEYETFSAKNVSAKNTFFV
ncbi:MAG: hypothetical protein JWQ09_1850 [Segetibacter sp.]|nr:hypothetical protein [Segetibacter sp.]